MKSYFYIITLFLLGVSTMVAQPTLTIKRAHVATWPTVEVFYTIHCVGQLNTMHTQANVTLSDDGLPVTTFTLSSPDTTVHHPMSVALVLDASGTAGGGYNSALKHGGTGFINKMNGGSDEAALVFFSTVVTLQQALTSAQSTLRNQLASLGSAGDRALFDGTHAGLLHVISGAQQANRAVVVASLGADNASTHTAQELIDLARQETVRIYTIGVGPSFDAATLRQLADSTGGAFYSVSDTAQLRSTYTEIYEHISDAGRESRLTFTTSCKDGALHEFAMEIDGLCNGSDSKSTAFRKPNDPSERTLFDLQIYDTEAMAGSIINVPLVNTNFVQGVLQPSAFGFTFPKSVLQLQDVYVTGSSPLLNTSVDIVPVGDNYVVRTNQAVVISQPGVLLSLKFLVLDRVDSTSVEITPWNTYAVSGCLLPTLHAGRVNIAVPPRPVIEALGPSAVCPEDSVVLRLTKPYDGYIWTTGDSTRSIVVRTAGNVGVAVMDHAGRTALSSPFAVQIFDAPAPRLTATDTVALCTGRSLELGTTEAFARYVWSTGDSSATVTIDSAGSYFVTVVDANGCRSSSDTVIVTLDESRVLIEADGPLAFCEGDTLRLRASDGFVSWRWNSGQVTPEIAVTAGGRYIVRAINAAGCEAISDTVDVIALPRPTTMITTNKAFTVCPGDSLLLDAQEGFAAYRWSTGATTRRIVVRDAGRYWAQVEGANGCWSSPVIVDIDAAVRPALTPGGAQVACYGEIVRVEASPGFASYRWNTGDTTRFVDLAMSGDYWVDAVDIGGCSVRSDTVILQIRRRIDPEITVEGSINICAGDSVVLSAPVGYISYYWNTGETHSRIVVRQGGDYHVTVYDTYMCSGTSRDVSVSLRQRPPKPDIVRQDAELTAPLATAWQWYRNGLAVPNATGRTYTVLSNGWYAVEVFNEFGCATRSDELQVLVTSVEALPGDIRLSLYPEPNDGIVQIELDAPVPARLRVLNLLGQTVAEFSSEQGGRQHHRFDLRSQPPGIYLLRVDAGSQMLLRRFIRF
ncbi:MAG: VWA domain-containing protein [Bacteroidetes bacterium]|nr:VWA domain-containing protein [Bacteroidota bacterium]